MRRIQRILPVALDEELTRLGKAQNVMRNWDEIVGPSLANRSAPDRFDKGVLWVSVEGSAWAQELRLMKEKILARLNEFSAQKGLFTDIRFGVRKLPVKDGPEPETAIESEPEPKQARELTIREIAKKRLERWRDVESG